MIAVRGIIGAYPNSFWLVSQSELASFAEALSQMASEADYQRLRDRFGIRRADPDFWRFSDEVHASYHQHQPGVAALLDYNRLENR